jgi:hypothetical protein
VEAGKGEKNRESRSEQSAFHVLERGARLPAPSIREARG